MGKERGMRDSRHIWHMVVTVGGLLLIAGAAHGQPADCPAPMYGVNAANTGQSHMVGIEADPVLAWETQVCGDTPYPRSLALSAEGILYTPGDDLYALRARDGQVVWQAQSGWRDSRAALDASGRLFAFEGGTLRARQASDGSLLWTGAPSYVSDGEPVKISHDGTVYAPEIRGVVYAYQPDGTLKWQSREYGRIQYGESALIPAIDQRGNIHFAGASSLVCLTSAGKTLWAVAHSSLSASRVMISADGDLVWQRDGDVEIRDAATGKLVDQFHCTGKLQAMDADNNLYFTSGTWLAKLDIAGQELWRYERNYMDWPLTVDVEGKVYAATQQGDIVAISAEGEELWDIHVTDAYPVLYSCAPVIGEEGAVYFLTRDGVGAIVPEPTTACLLILGGLALVRRRRLVWRGG